MITQFNRFEIAMTKNQAHTAHHQGECYQDVLELLKNKAIIRQFKKIDPEAIKAELSEYGAWNEAELSNIADNQARILWIAAGNIVEGV